MVGSNDDEFETRSVTRMRSTVLLKRGANSRSQRFLAVRQQQTWRSASSTSEDEEGEEEEVEENEDDVQAGVVPDEAAGKEEKQKNDSARTCSAVQKSTSSSEESSDSSKSFKRTPEKQPHADKSGVRRNASDDEESESEQVETVIDAVLAFQRWRQHNMKRTFSQELKKVLHEAHRDEASLNSLQRELLRKDENLVRALAESSNLRAHIAAIESAKSNSFNEGAWMEVEKAEARSQSAEEEIHKRDKEISRLKQRLKCLESEKERVGGNIQATMMVLQNDKAGLVKENRALLEQLGRKDQDLTGQTERADKLQTRLSCLSEYNAKIKAENDSVQASLQNLIKQEEDAKASLEKEVEDLNSRCDALTKEKDDLEKEKDGLVKEKDVLVKEKDDLAKEKHDLAKEKAYLSKEKDGLIMQLEKLTSHDNAAKSSEAIASGILEHLKILTGHMVKLEASFARNNRGPALNTSLHKIDTNLELALRSFRRSASSKAAGIRDVKLLSDSQDWSHPDHTSSQLLLSRTVQTDVQVSGSPEWPGRLVEETYLTVRDARTQTGGGESLLERHASFHVKELVRCIVWKWRWISAAIRAKHLWKQLRYSRPASKGSPGKSQKNVFSILGTMERELKAAMPGHNLVPILLSLWRAYRRSPKLERRAFSKDVPLDKVLAMIPWWIRRVGERRRLEQAFYHWYHLSSCSEKKQSYQLDSCYFHPHSCFNRAGPDEYQSVRRKLKNPEATLDGNYSQLSQQPQQQQQQGLVVRRRDLDVEPRNSKQLMLPFTLGYASSSFTARALRTLQISLQQEFQDLQLLMSKEMETVQTQVCIGQFDHDKSAQRRRTTFLWEVCNNLANALMDAHKQLVSLDREFDQRICNYLEHSTCSEQNKPLPASPRLLRVRPKSPAKQIEGRIPENFSVNARPNRVNLITRKPSSSSRKRDCIASQCAAILQSEFTQFSAGPQDTFDKSTMVQEDIVQSPGMKRPPWT